jgi:Ca2+-binding EF-hand superfamily protein
MYSYAVGFSADRKLLAIIPLDGDGNPGEAVILRQEDIESCKMGFQGDAKIKSPRLDKELRITVPGFTPPNAEDMCMLPVAQEGEAVAFKKFIEGMSL